MRWITYSVFVYLTLVLEKDLMGTLSLEVLGGLRPRLAGCLMVYVALFAPRASVLWGGWLLGLLVDLCVPPALSGPGGVTYLIGPHALGFVLGCTFILQLRAMVFRRRTLTFAMLTVGFVLIDGIVAVSLVTIRSWYPGSGGEVAPLSGLQQLMAYVGIALYSGLFAIPVGWLLHRTTPLWAFQTVRSRPSIAR